MQWPAEVVTAYTVFMFILGLVFGSFLNVVAYRVPRGESIVHPGSRCPVCGKRLSPLELVPVISWLALFGRCRRCQTPISVRYPVLELTTGVLFSLTAVHASTWQSTLAWCVFWLLLMALVGTDLTSLRVPNIISLPGFALCLSLSIFGRVMPWYSALLGAGLGYVIMVTIHFLSRGNMGMGDAKLYLSIGAMLGGGMAVESLVLAAAFGSVVGIGLRAFGLLGRRQPMPFVPYIAMGVVVTAFEGQSLWSWYLYHVLIR